ncbi:hypothetical protein [Plantactinospora sp. WMMB782]|uniref:hypothetical protein n=1 Tax=Plantactinospora sp. WMMB782 TaxID=3404121 RepID=UPI003B9590D8
MLNFRSHLLSRTNGDTECGPPPDPAGDADRAKDARTGLARLHRYIAASEDAVP